MVNFKAKNFKNKLYYTINAVNLNDSYYLSGYLYINANNPQKYLTTKLISAMPNHKNLAILIDLKL